MTDAIARADVLGHGFIELIDHMGDDLAIINNAKVSFDRYMTREDFDGDAEGAQKFIDFLVRERHGSPIEAVELKWRVKAPIFVFREWHRHRMAELNEESMRYSIKEHPEFYVPLPEDVRQQIGKPGSYSFEPITDPAVVEEAISKIELSQHFAFRTYHELVDMGVAKELARVVIPVGMFSTMIWKANLRSVMNFISLRATDPATGKGHAQKEIRVYADAMAEQIEHVAPMAMDAFNRFGRVAP
jgi:thymidylate synthase (FAD)